MKKLINLETDTAFDMKEAMFWHNGECILPFRTFLSWSKDHDAKLEKMADFGIVFVGQPSVEQCAWLAEENPEAIIFVVPEKWTVAHILHKLGAFGSVSEARKNGWNFFPEDGISSFKFRIKKIAGTLHIMKCIIPGA